MALTKIPRGLLDTGITDSSDATAITIDSSENVTFAGNIAHASNFTIDVGGDITLDADGGDINFHDGGTLFGQISNSSGLYLVSNVSDADIFIRGNDGGSMVNALTFDMSAAGAATFNSGVTLSGDLSISYQGGNIIWGTNYPAIGNIKSSQATLLGNNIKAGSANNTIVRHANGTDAGTFIGLTYNKGVTFHTGITTTQNSDAAETTNERMRIDPTGIVLIGGVTNTAGGYKFKIGGSDNQGEIALFSNATASDLLSYDRTNSHYLTLNIHASPTIFTQGYVGIGETSPDNKLHITGANWNNAHIKIERTDNGSANDPGIVFKSAAGANDAYGLGSMWFQNALDGNAYAMIRARTDDASGTSGKLEFVTSTSAVGNGTTPALTIDSNQIPVFRQGSYEAEIHNHSWAATLETTTSDGSDNYGVGLDAGGGAGSNARGAGIWCYGNENTSYPASIVAQVGSGGLFRIFAGTTGGSEALQVDAAGHLLPGSDSTKNLGSTSKRWDNLYVNDMHFSNEGSDGNDVDGTTGDWTLQEGEEHLYIINNKSGKKFKFSLEEVE